MTLGDAETARVLLALTLLLAAAHAGGTLFARLGQPRVIGEILGGLALGPTLLGALLPAVQQEIFPPSGSAAAVLAAVYQLGLIVLMYVAGTELRSVMRRSERRTAGGIALAGVAVPFAAALAAAPAFDLDGLVGPAGDETALLLVFGAAVAVTSIPVISRIMLDLGILGTSFARIVLSAAVIDDVVLYAVLAVSIGLTHGGEPAFGLAAALDVPPGSLEAAAYYAVATLVLLAAAAAAGRRSLGVVVRERDDPADGLGVGSQMALLLGVTTLCLALSVTPMLGGLAAGLAVAGSGERSPASSAAIRRFAFGFFVPVYFATVGLRLDLVRDFDVVFTLAFLAFACTVKAGSVYAGARLVGESPAAAGNFAVAMNARGGPGIVLAAVAFDAGIIDGGFYATLVMTAIVTSLMAGSWLGRVVRGGRPLRAPHRSAPARRERIQAALR